MSPGVALTRGLREVEVSWVRPPVAAGDVAGVVEVAPGVRSSAKSTTFATDRNTGRHRSSVLSSPGVCDPGSVCRSGGTGNGEIEAIESGCPTAGEEDAGRVGIGLSEPGGFIRIARRSIPLAEKRVELSAQAQIGGREHLGRGPSLHLLQAQEGFGNWSAGEPVSAASTRLPQAHAPIARFHIEHIVPRQNGGGDGASNLALACPRCNAFKGPNLSAIDPETGQVVTLFNPRADSWDK